MSSLPEAQSSERGEGTYRGSSHAIEVLSVLPHSSAPSNVPLFHLGVCEQASAAWSSMTTPCAHGSISIPTGPEQKVYVCRLMHGGLLQIAQCLQSSSHLDIFLQWHYRKKGKTYPASFGSLLKIKEN